MEVVLSVYDIQGLIFQEEWTKVNDYLE